MRTAHKITAIFGALFIVLSGAAYFFWLNLRPVSADTAAVNFEIRPGEGFREIGNQLYLAGLVRSARAIKIYWLITLRARDLKPGTYELAPGMSAARVTAVLVSGPPRDAAVVIPEGFSIYDIDAALAAQKILPAGAFAKYAKARGLEGRLFPDTYRFYFNSSPQAVADALQKNFEAKAEPLLNADAARFEENLVLASLLEKEVRSYEDRTIVAGILLKRQREGIPLQVDATVCYVKRIKNPAAPCYPITQSDLNADSPYNTYLYAGWPKGPIANPGLDSIRAAMNPQTTKYWYYFTDSATGKTIFSETLDKHIRDSIKYHINS